MHSALLSQVPELPTLAFKKACGCVDLNEMMIENESEMDLFLKCLEKISQCKRLIKWPHIHESTLLFV